MGCDIHLFAEKKREVGFFGRILGKKEQWEPIQKWEIDPEYDDNVERPTAYIYSYGRNYNLFAALAGVRSRHFKNHPSPVSEPKGLPPDCCKEIRALSDYWDSDGHSHSWNTLKELKDYNWAQWGGTCNDFLEEVIPKLKKENIPPDQIRIVYFFDN